MLKWKFMEINIFVNRFLETSRSKRRKKKQKKLVVKTQFTISWDRAALSGLIGLSKLSVTASFYQFPDAKIMFGCDQEVGLWRSSSLCLSLSSTLPLSSYDIYRVSLLRMLLVLHFVFGSFKAHATISWSIAFLYHSSWICRICLIGSRWNPTSYLLEIGTYRDKRSADSSPSCWN